MITAYFDVDRLVRASLPLSLAFVVLLLASGCGPAAEAECRTSRDCSPSQFCRLSRCLYFVDDDRPATWESSPDAGDGASDWPDADPGGSPPGSSDDGLGDDGPDAPSHPCPDAQPARAGLLVINELLPNVPTGPEGDANADGTRHARDDEFVELVNISPDTLELEGVWVGNDTRVRFTFAQHCLPPGHGAVIFAGSTTGAPPPAGEGFETWLSDSPFQFANDGGRATLYSASGALIDEHSYTNAPPRSLNRSPELTGNTFAHHTTLAEGIIFSPGTCADGRPLTTGCAPEPEVPDDENTEGDESSSDPSPPDDETPIDPDAPDSGASGEG